MGIKKVINNANTPADLIKGNKKLPPPPKLPNFPKIKLPKARFWGGGALGLAIADILTSYEPLSDGTLPPWIVDVGNDSQQIQDGKGSRPIRYSVYTQYNRFTFDNCNYANDPYGVPFGKGSPYGNRGEFWGPISGVRLANITSYGCGGYSHLEVLCHGRGEHTRQENPFWVSVFQLPSGDPGLRNIKKWFVVAVDGTPDPPTINTEITVNVEINLDDWTDKIADAVASKINVPPPIYLPPPISVSPTTSKISSIPDIPTPELPTPPPPEFPDVEPEKKGKTTIYPGGIDPKKLPKGNYSETTTITYVPGSSGESDTGGAGGAGAVDTNPQPDINTDTNPDTDIKVNPTPVPNTDTIPFPDWITNFDPGTWSDDIATKALAGVTPALITIQNQTTTSSIAQGTEQGICQSLNNPTACSVTPGNPNPTQGLKGLQDWMKGNLDGINALLNGANLALIKPIHDTVHHASHGLQAMQKFADTAWKTMGMDKVLQVANLTVTLHNATMLSKNAAETLGDAATAGLNAFNIKNPATGEPIDVNEVIGKSIKNKIQEIIGKQAYTSLATTWLNLNRIHQAAAGTISAIQGTKNAVLEADEITGGWIAKIGNSLQQQGIVDEESYDWMNETPDFNNTLGKGILGKVEAFEEFADKVNNVVQSGVEIQENSKEFIENSEELKKAFEEFQKKKINEEKTEKTNSLSPAIEDENLIQFDPNKKKNLFGK